MNPVTTYYMSKEEIAARYGLPPKKIDNKVSNRELKIFLKAIKPTPIPKILPQNDLKAIRRIISLTLELYETMPYKEAFNKAKKLEGWI